MGANAYIVFSVLSVTGAAVLLLGQSARVLALGWVLFCAGLCFSSLGASDRSWLIALPIAVGATILPFLLSKMAALPPSGFVPGRSRRLFAIASAWCLALLMLRAAHRSPHLVVNVGTTGAGAQLYWALYVSCALFGLGLLISALKRNPAHAVYGLLLLWLSPIPTALLAGARMRVSDGRWVAEAGVLIAVSYALAAAFVLVRIYNRAGFDHSQWEELHG